MSIPSNSFCIFRDGNQWVCTSPDFINLQESPSGYGDDIYEAILHFQENVIVDLQKRIPQPPKEG